MQEKNEVQKRGLIHVYTGDGKGKTTAAMGLALRAVGQGFKVHIIQFMKGGAYTGEFVAAKNYLQNIEIVQFGKGCVKEDKQLKLVPGDENCPLADKIRGIKHCGECRYCFLVDDSEKQQAIKAFELAKDISQKGEHHMLILDEINCAVKANLIDINDVIELINTKNKKTELILTGRNAPAELIELADLVTEMKEIKHPMNKGINARKGIEY